MSSQHQQFPIIDPNSLDENYQIVFDYDDNGNLRRIRKVRIRSVGEYVFAVAAFCLLVGLTIYFIS